MRAKANKWKYVDPIELARRIDAVSQEIREEHEGVVGYSAKDTAWRQRVLEKIENQPTPEETWAAMQEDYKQGQAAIQKINKEIDKRMEEGSVWDV